MASSAMARLKQAHFAVSMQHLALRAGQHQCGPGKDYSNLDGRGSPTSERGRDVLWRNSRGECTLEAQMPGPGCCQVFCGRSLPTK